MQEIIENDRYMVSDDGEKWVEADYETLLERFIGLNDYINALSEAGELTSKNLLAFIYPDANIDIEGVEEIGGALNFMSGLITDAVSKGITTDKKDPYVITKTLPEKQY